MEKLNIEPKQNNGARQKLINEGLIASEETVSNEEFNAVVGKTNELVEAFNFGTPITAFNFLENVPTYEDLPPTGNQVNDGYGVLEDGLIYVWNGLSFQSKGNGIDLGLKPFGKVVKGDKLAVSGDSVFEQLPEYIESKNLFNPNEIQYNKYVTTNSAIIQTGNGWACSGFIKVSPEDYYLSADKDRSGVGFYDVNKNPLRYMGINTGLIKPQVGEDYVVFNLKSDVSIDYNNVQFEKGSVPTEYHPFGSSKIIKETSVNKLEETIEKTNQSLAITEHIQAEGSVTDNLINPNRFELYTLLLINGGTTNESDIAKQYNTSDFTPVLPSTLYTGLRLDSTNIFRYTCFYRKDKTFISAITAFHTSFTTPANTAYVRTSVPNERHGTTLVGDMTNIGLFLGESPSWSYYGIRLSLKNPLNTSVKNSDEIATISDIKNLISEQQTIGFNFTYINGVLTCDYSEGTIVGQLKNQKGFTGNDMFNFSSSSMKGVSVGSSDDVAPMHVLNSTMGANHGYNHYYATITAHGFTNVDVGTEFDKGGVKFYVLRIVDSNTVAFISQNNGTPGAPVFVALTTGNITRSGNTFSVTAVSLNQLYPSIGQLNKKLVINGLKEINEDLTGNAEKVEAIESYVIYDPDSVKNNAIARAGQSFAPTMIGDPNVLVENIYRFVKEPACLVFSNVQFLKDIAFTDLMVSQAVIIGGNNGQTQYYIPNSNPLNGSVDLRKPTAITWSSSIPATFVVNANQPDPLTPPNRVIQYRGNVGFMLCYVLTRGQGKNIADYTNRTFEIRNNTGKVYPHPVEGTKVGVTTTTDSVYSVAMARVYTDLSKTRSGNRLSIFSFTVDNEKHVYIDYSGNMIDKINLEDFSLNGKKIEVLESKNAILKNTIYNNGFIISANYVEGETCYIVLIIK